MGFNHRLLSLFFVAIFAGTIGPAILPCVAAEDNHPEHPLIKLLEDELSQSMNGLVSQEGTKPYFIQYRVSDQKYVAVSATLGAITVDSTNHARPLDVEVRCGDYSLDNTHQIRAGYSGYRSDRTFTSGLPLNSELLPTRYAVWLTTDRSFKAAVKRLAQVKANMQVKVEEDDQSDDFSREKPSVYIGPWLELNANHEKMIETTKQLSARFKDYPQIFDSSVSVTGVVINKIIVNSEGSKLQFGHLQWRISVDASTIADDGMELWQQVSFDAQDIGGLPSMANAMEEVEQLIKDVLALREAPVVDPYTGPAILMNRSAGVFFHEIFGHRIEGHRQKDVGEGQTFARKLEQSVLPEFLSVFDDPTMQSADGVDLNGYFLFDDECVPAQRVTIVDKGILKTFLMSRSPTRGINQSNGHGRCQPGSAAVARQANLLIQSSKQVPIEQLREMLIAECKKQEKEYGLLFKDISGGLTTTARRGPQAFKVMPILVYRVYVDGRPDELVRGVDLVGTPLTCFSQILCTGNDPRVFNGTCGAESGPVPASVISPSILVEQIEVEKKQKSQDRPPILPSPIALAQSQEEQPK